MSSRLYRCTTCMVDFQSTVDLKAHHRSDWHRYNLKRKLAGMDSVASDVFERKLELLTSTAPTVKGSSHLKRDAGSPAEGPDRAEPRVSRSFEYISPSQCLFNNNVAASVEENIRYMEKAFSFFIPDREYLKDVSGLIIYLGKKVYTGNQCLYCNRPFQNLQAVRGHMIDSGHTSIGVATEEQREELEPFYDFSESYKEINLPLLPQLEAPEGDEEDWEDEEEEEMSTMITRRGWHKSYINEYGNLVLPNGNEVCHRDLAFVYRQNLAGRHHRALQIAAAVTHSRQMRAITEGGHTSSLKKAADLKAQGREQQKSYLKTGVNANRLQRKVKRADKYFI